MPRPESFKGFLPKTAVLMTRCSSGRGGESANSSAADSVIQENSQENLQENLKDVSESQEFESKNACRLCIVDLGMPPHGPERDLLERMLAAIQFKIGDAKILSEFPAEGDRDSVLMLMGESLKNRMQECKDLGFSSVFWTYSASELMKNKSLKKACWAELQKLKVALVNQINLQ